MPELPECRIMSDFINDKSKGKTFRKSFHVLKGNQPEPHIESDFTVESKSVGKEIIMDIKTEDDTVPIHVFMGMNGNWKYVPTEQWDQTKFVRFRMDDETGHSLLLHGGFMGPKYSIGKPFAGTKRGPDPTRDFDRFRENVMSNLDGKAFGKPICEVLLNQEYFNGIGNYIRSTILYYSDVNPFENAKSAIDKNPQVLDLCRDVPLKSYQMHGGQLRDWDNPFDVDSEEFEKWVFYQKGLSCKDGTGRTFWFDPKWESECPYKINRKK